MWAEATMFQAQAGPWGHQDRHMFALLGPVVQRQGQPAGGSGPQTGRRAGAKGPQPASYKRPHRSNLGAVTVTA